MQDILETERLKDFGSLDYFSPIQCLSLSSGLFKTRHCLKNFPLKNFLFLYSLLQAWEKEMQCFVFAEAANRGREVTKV